MEKNSELPDGWEICKITDLTLSRKIGIDRSRSKQFDHGNPYLKMNNITLGGSLDLSSITYIQCTKKEKKDYLLEYGDIVFNTRNSFELVGKTAFWNNSVQGCVYNNNIMRIKVHDIILPKFLVYFMNSTQFRNSLLSIKKATTNICAIYDKDLKEQFIHLPPLNEQKRIVKKIEVIFSKIDSSKQLVKSTIAQLKTTYESLLIDGITGCLSEQWRQTHFVDKHENLSNDIKSEQEKYFKKLFEKSRKNRRMPKYDVDYHSDTSPDEQIPQNWSWYRLGEIILHLTDYHSNASYELLRDNVRLSDDPDYAFMIRTTNFVKNDFINHMKYISKDAYDFLFKSKLFGGEILIGKIGNAGIVYYMPTLNQPSSLAMNLFALRFSKQVNSKYVYYHLISLLSKQNIQKYVKGVGNPTIDKKSIRSLWISLPSIEEQIIIVEILENHFTLIDKQISLLESGIQKYELFSSSILKQAFEGKLVPQDPNDEPASELLKRIKLQN